MTEDMTIGARTIEEAAMVIAMTTAAVAAAMTIAIGIIL